MRLNVERIVERGTNLTEVDQRSEALKQSSLQFQRHSATIYNRQWWSNLKWKIAVGVVAIVVIIIIVGKKLSHQRAARNQKELNQFILNFSLDCLWMIYLEALLL